MSQLYADTLREATRHKLRAGRALVEDGPDAAYTAAVAYHEAYRAEARALQAIDNPSREALLRSLVEQCGCLLDGLDPTGAHFLWGRILNLSERMAERTVVALTQHLRERSTAVNRRWFAILKRAPKDMREDPFLYGVTMVMDNAQRRRAARWFREVLSEFPGDAMYWMLSSLVTPPSVAWNAIRRARELMPDTPAYEMVALLVALDQAAPKKRAYVEHAFEKLRSAVHPEPAVCFGVAFAAITVAEERDDRAFWKIGREAARLGTGLVQQETLEAALFRFFALVAEARLAGQEPSPELPSLAGLPIPIGQQAPVQVLRTSPRLVTRFYTAAA